MKYKRGDRVRIKSIDWYNENKDEYGEVQCKGDSFVNSMTQYCDSILTIETKTEDCYLVKENTFFWTDEMIEGLAIQVDNIPNTIQVQTSSACSHNGFYGYSDSDGNEISEWYLPEGYVFKDENGNVINATKIVLEKKINKEMGENNIKVDMGEVSDGYHTFNELYEYRMLYNAALFNEFAKQGLYDAHKSRKHSDGEYPFGDSNWFIVMAELPTGQISNHYEMKDWDKFQIPEKPLANKWDEHSPRDVANRLTSFTTPKKEYPKTYEECCEILGMDSTINHVVGIHFRYRYRIRSFIKLLICRDAYWKIAGDEMGLGKPWEPVYKSLEDNHYFTICTFNGKIECSATAHRNAILSFPTEEIRDAFKENFDPDIEFCKELL